MHDTHAIDALTRFASTDAAGAADQSARAFEQAGARIEAALVKAAKTGELSFKDMAESILQDLARLAIHEIFSGLPGVLRGEQASLGSQSSPPQVPPVSIVMNISGAVDAGSLTRSQGQISAAIARAVSDGHRFF